MVTTEEATKTEEVVYSSWLAPPKKKKPPVSAEPPHALSFLMRHESAIVTGIAASVALAIVAAIVAVFSGYVANFVDNRIEAKLAPINAKLDAIQSAIPELQGELKRIAEAKPLKIIEDAAKATPIQLAKNLNQVSAQLEVAKSKGETVPVADLAAIQSTLLKVDDTSPGYWPLVFNLITYRSLIVFGAKGPPRQPVMVMDGMTGKGSAQLIHGGHIELRGRIGEGNIVDSWVEFDANYPVTLINVRFIHCVLVFRNFGAFDVRTPPPAIKQLGHELLQANLSDFKISAG